VFTVNGDGLNETFNISGIFILEYSLQVYNRYGEMIFESIDITNRWDGKHNQQDCSADVYFYTVRATGPKGQSIELKGNVTLLR
jgi:gliding motility-associated-like protein